MNSRYAALQAGALPLGYLAILAPQEGFEPPTYRLEGGCSILLSYWGKYNGKYYLNNLPKRFLNRAFKEVFSRLI